MPDKFLTVALLLVSLGNAAGADAADFPPGATVLDPDIIWDIANPDSFALSRDGKQIAYISKGALWVCRVDAGPSTKLADLPNTITAILADPANQEQREKSAASPHCPGYQAFYGPAYLDEQFVFSLAWTANQEGVVYAVRKRIRENSTVAAYHVMHAPLSGGLKEIAVIEGDFGVPREHLTSFHVTPDRKFVIASAYVPLIWDVLAARVRATPYDLLVASSTSGRFLGIEIDTRQLVLVDENFAIIERFAPTFQDERRVTAVWSDDERHAICCIYRPYGSREWDGFRLDLKTGDQRPQCSGIDSDRFLFTGRGGDVVKLGSDPVRLGGYADGSDGSYIAFTPDGALEERIIHRFSGRSRDPEKDVKRFIYPPIIPDRHASMIAMALPRPAHRPAGFHYHLIDRDGHATPFVPVSEASYITPYYPIAFADGGRRLIARSGATLFSLPVAAVAKTEGATDD